MIKKLKIRFVLVNMMILTLVLFSTLSGIYLLMYNSEIKMSDEIMNTLIENHKKIVPPNITDKFERNATIQKNLFCSNPDSFSDYDIVPLNFEPEHDVQNNRFYEPKPEDWEKFWNDYWKNNPYNQKPDQNNSHDNTWQKPPFNPWAPPETQKQTHPPVTTFMETLPPTEAPLTTPPASETSPEKTEAPPLETTVAPETAAPDVTEPPSQEPEQNNIPDISSEVFISQTEQTVSETEPVFTLTERFDPKPREPKPDITTKYNGNLIRSHIFVELNSDKEITDISYQYFFQYTDENESEYNTKIKNAISSIVSDGSQSGKYQIDSVSYRYKFSKNPLTNEYCLILLDRSIEISTLNRLMFTFIIIGCIGLVIVFFISLLLASWAIKPIETAWNKQKQFIADASHELKTPLTVISTNTDVVLSNPQDSIKNQERWLKYIKAETLRMSKLVTELLYIAKSDTNEIKMEMSEFDISNTVSSLCLVFEPLVFEAGRTLVSDISSRLKCYGDEDRVKQLITILLDNAVKYSLMGSQISVSLFQNNQNRIKFCISNQCEEMTKENISKLFDRFYRVDDSRNSKTGGNGLGLNIAQTIANSHCGNITVQYNSGMISFILTL